MPTSKPVKSGVWVGMVPVVSGRRRCAAREPASPRTRIMGTNRPTAMQNARVRLNHGLSAVRHSLGIDWGIADPILSDKDRAAPAFADWQSPFDLADFPAPAPAVRA